MNGSHQTQAILHLQHSEEKLRRTKKALFKATKDVDLIQQKLVKLMQDDRGSGKEEISKETDKLMKAETIRRSLDFEVRQRRQELIQAYGVRDQSVSDAARDFRELERRVSYLT
jgi:predicted DNA-binding ArsR family transcriptional regulator